MAVPPIIARLQGEAEAAGLFFDTDLALQAPGLNHAPPANPAVLPFNNRGLIDAAVPPPMRRCHDRALYTAGPALPVATTPCSSAANPHPHVFPGWPNRVPCPRVTLHGPGHSTCAKCLSNVRDQPWYQDIETNIGRQPGGLPSTAAARAAAAPQPTATWTDFITHLRRDCEILEKKRLRERLAPTPNTVLPPGRNQMINRGGQSQFPYNTCKCNFLLYTLNTQATALCLRHRHRTACNAHDKDLVIRQQNDQWLRQTARDPNNPKGLICLDRPRLRQKVTSRARMGVYRACRCGAEIKIPAGGHVPTVFMCLGCEGVIHPIRATAATLPPGHHPNRAMRSLFDDDRLKLRRKRDND